MRRQERRGSAFGSRSERERSPLIGSFGTKPHAAWATLVGGSRGPLGSSSLRPDSLRVNQSPPGPGTTPGALTDAGPLPLRWNISCPTETQNPVKERKSLSFQVMIEG